MFAGVKHFHLINSRFTHHKAAHITMYKQHDADVLKEDLKPNQTLLKRVECQCCCLHYAFVTKQADSVRSRQPSCAGAEDLPKTPALQIIWRRNRLLMKNGKEMQLG